MSNKKGKIRIVASLEGHVGPVQSVVFHPTAHLMATAGGDNDVKLWDTDSHQCLATLIGHTKEVTCVAFHPTQPVLISGSADKMLIVWDTTTYQWLSTIQQSTSPHAHMYGVTCIAIHPIMSFIVTSGYREPPKLWKLSPDNTKLIHMDNITSAELEDNVSTRCIAVHPTNPFFATGRNYFRYDSAALLWSYQQIGHRVLANLRKEIEPGTERHSSNIVSIAIHPTKPFIATGSDDTTIRLWGVNYTQDGKVGRSECMATLYDHEAAVTGLAFHPTAPILVSCSADTSVHVWGFSDDMRRVDIIGSLFGDRGPVTSIAFHSNGRLLATGNKENAALLWDCSVLTPEGQRSMGVMRGLEQSLVPKLFSGSYNMQHAVHALRNRFKDRGPNFLGHLEIPAGRAAVRAFASRRARAMIEDQPRSLPRSLPLSLPRSKARSKARSLSPPKSRQSSPSKRHSKRHSIGGDRGRTSITHRIKKYSSQNVKRRLSKTKRYRSK
jgi:WD40 repeat protein